MSKPSEELFEIPILTEVEEPADPANLINEENPENPNDELEILEEDSDGSEVDIATEEIIVPTFNYMKDKGFFSNLGDKIEPPKTEEEYFQLIEQNREKERQVMENDVTVAIYQQIINNTPEYLRDVVNATLTATEPVSHEQYLKVVEAAIPQEVTEEDLKKEDVAEAYMTNYFKSIGLDEDTIELNISALKDKKTLLTSAHNTYQKEEKNKKIVVDNFVKDIDDKNKKIVEDTKNFHDSISSELKNSGWRKDKIELLQKSFSSGDYGKRLEIALKSTKAQLDLIDFMSYFDGKSFNVDKFIEARANRTGAALNKEINKAGYFKSKSNSGRNNNNEDLTVISLVEKQ